MSALPRTNNAFFLCTMFLAGLLATSSAGAGDTPITTNPRGQAVVDFLDMVFNQRKVREGFDKYVGETYRQHNPFAPDGREAAIEILTQWLAGQPAYRYDFKRVLVDGDLVAVHSHVTNGENDRGRAVVDIFRFDENGKIVEHWDVIQDVPEKSANDNTMF